MRVCVAASSALCKSLRTNEAVIVRYTDAAMPLTLRPTGLQSPAYADRQDWTVFEDGCVIGRLYEDSSKSTAAGLRWFWSITRYVPPRLNVRTNDKVGSLTEAEEQFRRAWEAVGVQAAWADGYSATEYAGLIELGIRAQL
jgi:hypothetical protein